MTTEVLTWSRMKEIEPGLERLRRELTAVEPGDDPEFCAHDVWFGRCGAGYKHRIEGLVGWDARRPELQSEAAYDMAYDKLYNLLPDCRDCGCL